jgi:hypothetical protein
MLPQLPLDKANHYVYGSLIFTVSFAVLFHVGLATVLCLWAALAITGLLSVGKEILDWVKNKMAIKAGLPPPHVVEPADALATFAGGLVAAIPVMLLLL